MCLWLKNNENKGVIQFSNLIVGGDKHPPTTKGGLRPPLTPYIKGEVKGEPQVLFGGGVGELRSPILVT